MAEKNMPALPKGTVVDFYDGLGTMFRTVYSAKEMRAYAQQYAEQRVREEREACLQACKAEHLEDPQDREDDAYDRGVYDCISAIRQRSKQ